MRCPAGAVLAAAIAASGCAHPPKPAAPRSATASPSSRPSPRPTLPALVPAPAIVELGADEGFTLGAGTVVAAASSDPAVQARRTAAVRVDPSIDRHRDRRDERF